MSKGGRFFLRVKHEEYFDGKQWRRDDGGAKLKNPRRVTYHDKEITHAVAIRWMLDNCIPCQMWGDFSQQHPKDTGLGEALIELESSVQQANSLLYLLSSELGREVEEGWGNGKGAAIAAGIHNLCHNAAEALTLAFNETHEARRRLTHPDQEDAA